MSELVALTTPAIETTRLRLRAWRLTDAPFFAHLHADPMVRRYFYPPVLEAAEAYGALKWIIDHWRRHGFGFFAVERRTDGMLIGGAGLSVLSEGAAPATLRVEIGWIFASDYWGQGLAREAAAAALQDAWSRAEVDEVIAFMTCTNRRSRALAERLGMTRDHADDFEDESIPAGHWQRPHVLYRIRRSRA